MPELPEVQTVVDTLKPRLVGARFSNVRLMRDDIVRPADCELCQKLAGRTVSSITRRAKRIVFALDDGNQFYVHLGMTGRLTIEQRDTPLEMHTHLIASIAGGNRWELRFCDARRFGGIWWIGNNVHADRTIGPEPLTLRVAQLAQRLSRTARVIKSVLLDQRVIAGLGNIYADESLFAARIHPLTRANELSERKIRRLNRAIKLTLRQAIRHRGSTLRDYVDADGASGAFQRLHKVYGRAALPCTRCKHPIKRIVVGGRSTHFCPNCQSCG